MVAVDFVLSDETVELNPLTVELNPLTVDVSVDILLVLVPTLVLNEEIFCTIL